MRDEKKYQQLSCRDAGQFDKKFRAVDAEGNGVRIPVTGWEKVCRDRAARGVSRSARLKAKKEAA
jgi:hypothetical protein